MSAKSLVFRSKSLLVNVATNMNYLVIKPIKVRYSRLHLSQIPALCTVSWLSGSPILNSAWHKPLGIYHYTVDKGFSSTYPMHSDLFTRYCYPCCMFNCHHICPITEPHFSGHDILVAMIFPSQSKTATRVSPHFFPVACYHNFDSTWSSLTNFIYILYIYCL